MDIPLAEITADIIATGVVLVYFEAYPGSGRWSPLPMQWVAPIGDIITNIVYEVMEGNIRLHYFNMRNSAGAALPDLQVAVTSGKYFTKQVYKQGKTSQFLSI